MGGVCTPHVSRGYISSLGARELLFSGAVEKWRVMMHPPVECPGARRITAVGREGFMGIYIDWVEKGCLIVRWICSRGGLSGAGWVGFIRRDAGYNAEWHRIYGCAVLRCGPGAPSCSLTRANSSNTHMLWFQRQYEIEIPPISLFE